MRTVIQRVLNASVTIDGVQTATIGAGILCLIGISSHDAPKDRDQLIAKILKLRIFEDEAGKMNKSVVDVGGEILLVSQFTLYGDCKKGNRPSFINAMPPAEAAPFYQAFIESFVAAYPQVKSGVFQADMKVALVNDGPVTIILDTEKQV